MRYGLVCMASQGLVFGINRRVSFSIQSRHAAYPPDCWQLHIDGSAMPNPGRMAVGAVLQAPDGTQHHFSQALPGTGCNNEAEMQALVLGIEQLQSLGGRRVVVHTDSSVLLDQLHPPPNARHAPRAIARLAQRMAQLRERLDRLDYVELRWVPRHRNTQADALARAALV